MRLTKPVMLHTDKYTYRQIKVENEKTRVSEGITQKHHTKDKY